ncbi:MAG TPA: polymer-forming cytoskeletal protein [bacterium]|nr:polymer-forming cytoskeletal protein [bacterium]HQL61601.1 polymer-forming cytoskeletal protein [bacterium]
MSDVNDDWNGGIPEAEDPELFGPGVAKQPSVVDSDVAMEGDLQVGGGIEMDGKFRGTLRCGEVLTIGPNGETTGDIEAVNVVIGGLLEGSLLARKRLEIRAGGTFFGELVVQPEVLVLAEKSEFARERPKDQPASRKVVEMPVAVKKSPPQPRQSPRKPSRKDPKT